MKKIKQVGIMVLLVVLVLLLSSCDFLLPAPLGRDNPADDGVQISNFGSFFAGNNTALLLWNWKPYSGTDPSRKIVKVRIVHNEQDRPSSMYPLDKNDVTELSSGDSFIWKNLKEYKDHYFALYRMEEGGTWLSPLYARFYLNGSGYIESPGPPPMQYMYTDMVPNSVVQSSSASLNKDYRGFIQIDTGMYNNSDMGAIESAELNFNLNVSNINGNLNIVPMLIDIYDGELWDDISNPVYYDMSHAVSCQVSKTVAVTVDISTVLNYCRVYGTHTFALIIPPSDPGTIDNPDGDISLQPFTFWRAQ